MKKRALQLLGGTALGLLLAEGMFWVADDGAFPHLNVYEADTTLGARLRPGATQRVAFGGNPVTSVRINAEGFRGADWGPPSRSEAGGEVVVLGDSQVFGLGVEEDQTASAVLAATLGRPVRNAGIPTHGPPEYLAVLDELLASRKPDTVVLVLNFSNDLFEVGTPNPQRHAVWDGWAVRLETAPATISDFPGRRWLFSQSHLVHAIRRAWWTPPEAWEQGVASEGTWAHVAGLAKQATMPATATDAASSDTQLVTAVQEASRDRWDLEFSLIELYTWVFPEAGEADLDLAVEAAVRHAHAGDIVGQSYAESSRSIVVTAEQLREGARIRKELEARLAKWADEHPGDRRSAEIREALADKAKLDQELGTLATRVAGAAEAPSPLASVVEVAKARCDAAGAELLVVALPLDVQVSDTEWAKYGAEPRDMSGTRALLADLVRDAERMGVRALDATEALAAAEPGAFLNADLHMTPKGQAALGAAIAAKLAEPAPFAQPRPGLPAGRSRVPTWEELALAPEIVVKGSTKNRCSTRQLREWLVVDCRARDDAWYGGDAGPDVPKPRGVTVVQGAEAMVGGDPYTNAVLVAPLVPGRPLSADFTWNDRRTERLAVTWEGDMPRIAFTPTPYVEPASAAACVEDLDPYWRRKWFGDVSRGCDTAFPADCEAQRACGAGTRAALPTCPEGQVNAGSAGHCYDLCDTTRACVTGTCTNWQGAGVCL